jgi:hypothetical protein
MKKILVMTLSIFSIQALAIDSEDCMSKYRRKAEGKRARYNKAYKNYKNRRNSALSSQMGGGITGGSLLGAAILQNDSPPDIDYYNMYEEKVLAIVDYDVKSNKGYKPRLLTEIYNQAYEKYSDVTSYQRIQDLVLKGIMDDTYCGFFGKYNESRVSKYVLKHLKKESGSSAIVRDPAVIGSSFNAKEGVDYNEEIEKPTEETSRGIDE